MFTSTGLTDIKAAEDIYLAHPDWKNYCLINAFNRDGSEISFADATCAKLVSALTIFYPDAFDAAVADAVMTELDKEDVLTLYQSVAPCVEKEIACDGLLEGVDAADVQALRDLAANIDTITTQWTGKTTNPQVSDPEKMAKFFAYMKVLPTRAGLVDFYFDSEFSIENPKTMYTRSIIRFGGPRDGFERETQETNTFYFMTQLIFDIFIGILIRDTMAAVISVLLVYFYLWYMLGSLFLASTGMLEILLSDSQFALSHPSPKNSLKP